MYRNIQLIPLIKKKKKQKNENLHIHDFDIKKDMI